MQSFRWAVFLFSFWCSFAISAAKPVYFFHDGAFDDVFALILVLSDPNVDVKHIVLEATGETTCEKGVLSTLGVLKNMKKVSIPVSCGPAMSLSAKQHGIYTAFPEIWRKEIDSLNAMLWTVPSEPLGVLYGQILKQIKQDPMMYENYQRALRQFQRQESVEYIAKQIRNEKEPIHILELGPLTTPAYLAQVDPAIFKKIASFTIMGGAFELDGYKPGLCGKVGNVQTAVTPGHILNTDAEWNIYTAPLDAGITLQTIEQQRVPLYVVPLNATSKAKITLDYEQALKKAGKYSWRAQFVSKMLAYYSPQIVPGFLDFWDSLTAYLFLEDVQSKQDIFAKTIMGYISVDARKNSSPQRFYKKYNELKLNRFYQPAGNIFMNALTSHQQWAKITTNEPSAIDTYGVMHFWPKSEDVPKIFSSHSAHAVIYTDIDASRFKEYFISKLSDSSYG